MKEFIYKARDASGKLISRAIEAENSEEAVKGLKEKGYLLISIKELRRELSASKRFKKKVPPSEINIFSRQLAYLLKAGVPFLLSLTTIKEQTSNGEFKRILEDLIRDVKKGSFFSEALAKYEYVFGKIYVGMVKAAEASGTLDEILERLVILGERQEEIKSQIKSATTYPAIALSVLGIAFVVLVTFVIPKFVRIFSQFKTELPLPTRFLIGLNFFISNFWYVIIIVLVGMVMGARFLIKTPKGRFFWDKLMIRIPVAGPLILKIALSRFARAAGTLTKTGISIIQVLDLARESVENSVLNQAISDISSRVVQGKNLSLAMRESGVFPPLVVQMVSSGEQTGQLGEFLLFISDYYDTQVKYDLKNLITYIEPILIIVLSAAVLFIALAVFLPMWSLIQLFKY